MKYENVAEIGQKIRAYDFEPIEGREDQYIEGVVLDKGWVAHPKTSQKLFKGYTIEIQADCDNDGDRIGDTGYVPFETTFDFDGRVQKVIVLK